MEKASSRCKTGQKKASLYVNTKQTSEAADILRASSAASTKTTGARRAHPDARGPRAVHLVSCRSLFCYFAKNNINNNTHTHTQEMVLKPEPTLPPPHPPPMAKGTRREPQKGQRSRGELWSDNRKARRWERGRGGAMWQGRGQRAGRTAAAQ